LIGIIKDSPSDDEVLSRFLSYVEESGLTLYEHQEEAILEWFADRNVILNTPTGSGKSLVALAAHFRGLCHGRRSCYTVPIKALANEKFLALCRTFGPDQVGLVTGDATVNPGAPVICCTAEILSNRALREGEQTDIADVVIDEFHYYSDPERGAAWQIPLLTLPRARFLLMSATLGDTSFFERELTALTGAPTTLVQSGRRPVPLEFEYSEIPLEEKVGQLVAQERAPVYLVHFTQLSCHQTAQNLLSQNFCSKAEKQALATELANAGFSSPYGREIARFARSGVGVHHAGLLPKYRVLIEKLAQQGLLKVICGTDTLGVGVNVPIRTVAFTGLCKYDGRTTRILTVRDFKQISGRAGRRGFDEIGYVVAQAPEHVIENLRLKDKAARRARGGGKARKPVLKKPPPKGFVNWTEETFRKLIDSPPERLASSFQLNHGIILNVLSRRHEDGCAALKALIQRSHGSPASKQQLRRHGRQLFRGLVEGKVLDIIPPARRTGPAKVKLNVELQEEFSLNQALGLWLLDALPQLDEDDPRHALNVLSLVEAILENPDVILRKQTEQERDRLYRRLKEEGAGYDELMERLAEVEWPMPGREFIYDTFNEFVRRNPWIRDDAIRPKSIAREMFDEYLDFPGYIRKYKLERSEGVLLRHLSEVYKVLSQTVPPAARSADVAEAEAFFEDIVRGVDASLLDEWEQLRDPAYDPEDARRARAAETRQREAVPLTRRKAEFDKAVRSAVHGFLKALRDHQWDRALEFIQPADPRGEPWNPPRLQAALEPYLAEFPPFLLDPEARNARHTHLATGPDPGLHQLTQTLVDPDHALFWQACFRLDLAATDRDQRAALIFEGFERM